MLLASTRICTLSITSGANRERRRFEHDDRRRYSQATAADQQFHTPKPHTSRFKLYTLELPRSRPPVLPAGWKPIDQGSNRRVLCPKFLCPTLSNLKIVEQQHEGAVLNSRDRKCTPSDSASRDSRGRVYALISETRATMAIKFIERNAHVCFEVITRTTTHWWKASGSESKK